MAIDPFINDTITMEQAARELPGSPAVSTVWRWSQHGVRGERLETIRIGRHMFTTRAAISDFIARLSEKDHADWKKPPVIPR